MATAETVTDYEALVEFLYLTPVGIIKFQPCGKIEMANPAAAMLLMPLARDADMSDLYNLFADLAPDLRERVEQFKAPAGQICDQMQLAVPGTHTVLTLSINKINSGTLMAVVQDITRAVEQETRIRDDQQRFRAIFESIRDYAIYTVDLGGHVNEWNRSLNRLGGWESGDVAGASLEIFYPPGPDRQAQVTDLLDRARQQGSAEFEGWNVRNDGSNFWGSTVATVLPDREARPSGYVLVTRDLTERKRVEDRLVMLSTTDPLTGACNRRGGEDGLLKAFHNLQRHGRLFAVLIVDVDHFKTVNDRWGHDVGDCVLVSLVKISREQLRALDVIIRWGGEEFLILLPDTGCDVALIVAERLRKAVEAAKTVANAESIMITISVGIAGARESDSNLNDIIRRADHALYAAKSGGRNQAVFE